MTTSEIIVLCAAVVLSGIMSVFWGSRSPNLTEVRLARLERKLDKILAQLGVAPDTPSEQILELIRDQQKIQAIALYRKQNGTGLRESKDAIEEMAARMKAEGVVGS